MKDLQTLATELSVEPVPGMYRPLNLLLLQLPDLHLDLHKETFMLHWFNCEERLLWLAIGADGAPFG